MFRQLMKKIDKVVDKCMPFDKDFTNEGYLSAVSEWALMSLVALIAGEDVNLHDKLSLDIATLIPAKAGSISMVRIDVFQAVALMEVPCPVKFAIFLPDKDLMEINIRDSFTFSFCCTEEAATLVQPVIFTVIILSRNYVSDMVVNTKGNTGTWIKRNDELL